jgi:hypothetical protein
MITVETVTRRYGRFAAIDNVSFTAQARRVTGTLEPNVAHGLTAPRTMPWRRSDAGSSPVGAGPNRLRDQRVVPSAGARNEDVAALHLR